MDLNWSNERVSSFSPTSSRGKEMDTEVEEQKELNHL